jgi:hypothetical protein
MIDLLPKDGGTFDLMEWWFRFTLDASSEYLFGKSVDSLLDPTVPLYSISLTEVIISKGIRAYSTDSDDAVQGWPFMAIILSTRLCVFNESPQ